MDGSALRRAPRGLEKFVECVAVSSVGRSSCQSASLPGGKRGGSSAGSLPPCRRYSAGRVETPRVPRTGLPWIDSKLRTRMPSGCARLPSCRGRKADVPVKQSAPKAVGPKASAAKPAAAKAVEAPAGAKEGNKGKAKKGGPPPAAAAFLARCCSQLLRDHEARAASLLISRHPVRARLPCRVEHRAGKRRRRRLLPLPPPKQALLPAGRMASRATTTTVMNKKRSAWLSTPLGPRRRTLQASRPAWKGY